MMNNILLLNPNKWGRGITSIWIASHSAMLKKKGHEVELFDSTFYKDWTVDEILFNTNNQQYMPTNYTKYVNYFDTPVKTALKNKIDSFKPDVIFWSAISSHIHGEGEYVNIQYGYELLKDIETDAILVTGGLQATARAEETLKRFPKIDYLIQGYSESTLALLIECIDNVYKIRELPGVACWYDDQKTKIFTSKKVSKYDISLIPEYDYSVFDDQVFWRPYNGEVLRAVDYEISRGCIYSCDYCVETIIQNYYGHKEHTSKGSIRDAKTYVQTKSAEDAFSEIKSLHHEKNIKLFRCQDTNFLTMNRNVLYKLSDLVIESEIEIMLYIETRPETINNKSIEILKKLNVDGVGMGVELSSEEFRMNRLSRFASTEKIIRAFELLRDAGIKRTAYNIIGLPDQDENSILDTIKFNQILDPDNITVAFYSPYIGTNQQVKSKEIGYFDDYEYHVDGQLRTVAHTSLINTDLLNFYKLNFSKLVRNGLDELSSLKDEYFSKVNNG